MSTAFYLLISIAKFHRRCDVVAGYSVKEPFYTFSYADDAGKVYKYECANLQCANMQALRGVLDFCDVCGHSTEIDSYKNKHYAVGGDT